MKSFSKKSVALMLFATIFCSFFYFNFTKAADVLAPSIPSATTPTPESSTLLPSEAGSQTTMTDSSSTVSNINKSHWYDIFLNPGAYAVNLGLDVTFSLYEKILQLILTIVDKILVATAFIFDTSIRFSLFQLRDLFSGSASVINDLWALIRDTANIFFIFILLYVAIRTIIGSSSMKAKEMVVNVVISAVFVNFSMFITRILIDFGNIIATAFYNQIAGGGENITSTIKNNLNLDQLFSATHFTATATSHANLIMGLTISIILVGVTAYVYLYAAFIFVGRAAMLIVLTITSPVGFVGNTIPGLEAEAKDWRKSLTHQILVAPIFLLFMVMITKITSNDTLQASIAKASGGGLVNVAGLFYYVIVIKLLFIALKKTKELSGEVGNMVNKAISGVTGVALAAVTGGTSFVGQQVIGRGAAALAESDRLKAVAATSGVKGVAGRLALKATVGTSKATFDIRNAELAKGGLGLLKERGIDLAGGRAKGVKGGFVESREAYAKAQSEFTKANLGREISDEVAVKEYKQKYEAEYARERLVKESLDEDAKNKIRKLTDEEVVKEYTKSYSKAPDLRDQQTQKEQDLNKVKQTSPQDTKQIEKLAKELAEIKGRADIIETSAQKDINGLSTDKALTAIKKMAEERKKAYQEEFAKTEEGGILAGAGTAFEAITKATGIKTTKTTSYAKAAAETIRKKVIKGKTDEEQFAELAKKMAKEQEEKEKQSEKKEEEKTEEKPKTETKPEEKPKTS